MNSQVRARQVAFNINFIWVALATAIFGGFAIGGHLSAVIGYSLPLGNGFLSFIQAHGHLQLIGWAGLFIMGVSLHFIPRLSSVPISQPQWVKRLPWLVGIGLLCRMVGQTAIPYLDGNVSFVLFSCVAVCSGVVEWYAILVYLSLLIGAVAGTQDENKRATLLSVRPYLGMMITGFFLYTTINIVLLIQMGLNGGIAVNQRWNELAIQIFVLFVLLPVAFAFSIRMFPLYLRLPAADWGVRGVAYVYLFSVLLQLTPTAPLNLGRIARYIASIGMVSKGGVLLWFVWKLDLLTRLREPWTAHRALQPSAMRRPTRPKIPDYGEFGRFERLVYAAYVWLVLGALLEITLAVFTLFEITLPISGDAVRHIYLLGFITNLILGMAVRMIPGFMRKRRVRSAKLVDATFWLANIAAVSRIVPLILPSSVFEITPAIPPIADTVFAFSGTIGLGAIVCLAVNLWLTVR